MNWVVIFILSIPLVVPFITDLPTRHYFRLSCTDENYKQFYTMGVMVGNQYLPPKYKYLLTQENIKVVLNGFYSEMTAKNKENDIFLAKYGPQIQPSLTARFKNIEAEAEAFSQSYLQSNPTAYRTPSGLIFHRLQPGIGTTPKNDSIVFFRYTTKLLNGKVVDNTMDSGPPIKG